LLLEESPKIVPDCRVVVYHQDPNQAAAFPSHCPKKLEYSPEIGAG
jgi:hypothetical protein